MRYYIKRNDNVFGPFSLEEIKELLIIRGIELADLVAPEGSQDFQPLAQINLINLSVSNLKSQTTPPNSSETDDLAKPSRPVLAFQEKLQASSHQDNFSALPTIFQHSQTVVNEIETVRKYRKPNLIAQTFDVLTQKFFSWIGIALIPFLLILVLFYKNFDIIFQQILAPAMNKTQVIFINEQGVFQLIIIALFTIYFIIASVILFIKGTFYCIHKIDFDLFDLFKSSQSIIPKLLIFSLLFGLLFGLFNIPFTYFPDLINPLVPAMSIFIFLCLVIRFLPVPIIIVLEDKKFLDSVRYALKITKGHSMRMMKLLVVIIGGQLLISMSSPLIGIAEFFIELIYYITILIYYTLFYLNLNQRI